MTPPLARTLHDMLEEQAALRPAAPAVICAGRVLSFAALAARVRAVASALRARGLRHGERVGILMNNRAEFLEAALGASAAGAVVVPFSTWSTRQELDFLLADSGVRTLFALPGFGREDFVASLGALVPEAAAGGAWRSARFPALRDLVLVGAPPPPGWLRHEALIDGAAPLPPLPPGEAAGAGDDGIILYTSGSTSRPKAVRLVQHGIVENGFNIGERQGLGPGDRVLVAVPLFWAYGAVNAMPATLTHGATLVLQSRFEPGEALDLIERHRCTSIYTLPAMTAALIRHPEFRPARTASLRKGLTIGAPQDLHQAATVLGAAHIANIYGSSECYGNCCVTPHDWPLDLRSTCQGPPLPGVRLRIRDQKDGRLLGPGRAGLIEVSGYLTRGYGGASAGHNAAAFTEDGWFRTGDIGEIDGEGRLRFLGRSGEMIKRSGINISPAEVEDVLMQHPGVSQAAVVGVPDAEKGELIVAFIVPRPDAHPGAEELAAHCRSLASAYKVPDRIEIRPALPTTVTGKLLRRELKDEAAALPGDRG
ncbi:class I adenylate-forming enzyme family protein [Falsiroseomonas sp. CW058]|uniref:class I adenylate-forming enzyme family protein n=1 Tax=Falsiroseomonas sp. CW058 TaxID=3388664 RepID=UPI003D318392